MASDQPRTRASRARAEDALVRLVLESGPHASDFVVIGGLNPDYLAPNAPEKHMGTTDVDVLLKLGVIIDRDELDFGWLDRVFAGQETVSLDNAGWRWMLDSGREIVVIELLCDVYDNRGQAIALPGASQIAAMNLDGPAPALHEPVERLLYVSDAVRAAYPDAPLDVTIRFASVGGYLLAKAAALVNRKAAKDYYDFMYVLLYGDGGSAESARLLRDSLEAGYAGSHSSSLRMALLSYIDGQRPGAAIFAQQMTANGSEEEFEILREDATGAAQRVLALLNL
ncbi:hypothetical protein E3T61_01045 [Cryobacterium lactosi]|uniref:Uncharacterized protein n=1 Tax=Cryobacterium lactosi TaxID=1259202 RepID=A0A4R9C1L2_9MICO|nr:hypothetical protein [Cryobacterium lactosi]TFD95249.1 hypothetical protein E3T61_01045 [Cryobacterium lactosi]